MAKITFDIPEIPPSLSSELQQDIEGASPEVLKRLSEIYLAEGEAAVRTFVFECVQSQLSLERATELAVKNKPVTETIKS